jgi:hypothetical protein
MMGDVGFSMPVFAFTVVRSGHPIPYSELSGANQ